ncbi:hypothetical protein QBC44DRAFT_395472 [Cladorrhinum sp. PSN332]|nr:hypothetical protein QBC44DRAFT_395472 [Cladorrhinum sp. PSN332]
MVMNQPESYNLNIQPLLQVDPLGPNVLFPCHNSYNFNDYTIVQAVEITLLNFTGSAQHGGGSCQFSISYDYPNGPGLNQATQFKTLYTIIGGCPSVFTDETKNLDGGYRDSQQREDSVHCGNDSGINCVRQFWIPLPKFLKNGPATFAWTWFNKIGRREMYMNCAPINITGGNFDQAEFDSLPTIFVANYQDRNGSLSCVTGNDIEHLDVNVPNPGKYGRVLVSPIQPTSTPPNYCSQIPTTVPSFESNFKTVQQAAGGDTAATTTTTTSSPRGTPSLSTLHPTDGATTTLTSTVRISFTGSIPPSPPFDHDVSTQTARLSNATMISSTVTNSSLPPYRVIPSASYSTATVIPIYPPFWNAIPCTAEGSFVCIDATKFGHCSHGWMIPQPVAPGTMCVNGQFVWANA